MAVSCCKDCAKRTEKCHIDCDVYIHSKEEYAELKKRMINDRELDRYKAKKKQINRAKYMRKYGKSYV